MTIMQPEYEFEAVLEASDDGVFVALPVSVVDVHGARGRVPVQGTFDGYPYQGRTTSLGEGHHGLLILKQIRRAINKTVGDTVLVTLSRNAAERKMEVPEDLADQLAAAPKAAAFFAGLTYTQQREFVRWLEGAKRPEARVHRLGEIVALLEQGRKRK